MFCFNSSRYSSINATACLQPFYMDALPYQHYLWYCKYWNYGKILAPNRGTDVVTKEERCSGNTFHRFVQSTFTTSNIVFTSAEVTGREAMTIHLEYNQYFLRSANQ